MQKIPLIFMRFGIYYAWLPVRILIIIYLPR